MKNVAVRLTVEAVWANSFANEISIILYPTYDMREHGYLSYLTTLFFSNHNWRIFLFSRKKYAPLKIC